MKTFSFASPYVRSRKHRTHKGVRVTTVEVVAESFPVGMPRDANPRSTNIDKKVYREMKASLLGKDNSHPGTFDLMHGGFCIVSDDCSVVKDGGGMDEVTLTFSEGLPAELQGTLDGGHSATLIERLLEEGLDIPSGQSVMFEIITGLNTLPTSVVVDVARARNSGLQVADKSLMNLNQDFDWLKKELGAKAETIAWVENDDGEIDVTDLIAILSCFDTATYPGRAKHPLDAERRKKTMLSRFADSPGLYKRLVPLLDDILHLAEHIEHDAENQWGKRQERNGWSNLGYVKNDKTHTFLLDNGGKPIHTKHAMPRAALLPVLAAFRGLVEDDPSGEPIDGRQPVRWHRSYKDVLKIWDTVGGTLLRHFHDAYKDSRDDASAAARTTSVWDRCYTEVKMACLELGE